MITTAVCDSFLREVVDGLHRVVDEYRLALIRQNAKGTFGPQTSNYSQLKADEASGTGYTRGGAGIERLPSVFDGSGMHLKFGLPMEMAAVTLQAAGALVYNARDGRAVFVHQFKSPVMVVNAPLVIDELPATVILKG